MAWEDRLREAAYTSPSGSRIRFEYTSVSRLTSKHTTAFDFPGVPNAYVQDNGHGSRRYALRCFFSGPDHDLEATAFEAALLERGRGRLEHPLYGTVDVVPYGDITRRDDLRDAANQSIVEVTFWTSVSALYPTGDASERSEVEVALVDFVDALAEQFAASADLSTVAAKANEEARVRSHLTAVQRALRDVAAETESVRRRFTDAARAVDSGLSVLVGEPLELARSMAELTELPAYAAAGIQARVSAYRDLAVSIITAPRSRPAEAFVSGVIIPGRRRTVANDFHSAVIVATSACAGAIRSVLEHRFTARPHAIAAAAALLDLLDLIVAWMDEGFTALAAAGAPGGIDTGAGYQALQEAVALAAGYLVEISFTLLPERRVVLDRPRTIIDLAAELYGAVDERLDFLIDTNELSGSEILELPRGTSIVYYA